MRDQVFRCCVGVVVTWFGFSSAAYAGAGPRKPNIVVIVADDLGFADVGVHGCKDIPTPHIDSLAKQGVFCRQGYVSAPQCSPTRAGLLTGRYQQRFGHEHNAAKPGSALSLQETTLAQRLRLLGYVTGMVGKWHLGIGDPKHHPLQRGFQEFFGFLGGAHSYVDNDKPAVLKNNPILRGTESFPEKEYLTDAFGREAVAFIERHHKQPFFLYLAFNAPHGPLQAPEKYLKRFAQIEDKTRRTYAAMISAMDDAIGRVLAKLEECGVAEDTLIFFLSDNGGPLRAWNGSSNYPLRGEKGDCLEGGLRTPFLIRWKAGLPAGKIYQHPVISLDILPTSIAAAGGAVQSEWKLDGVNLLPHLRGKIQTPPHEVLYWRFHFPPRQEPVFKWAVRQGDWKLVKEAERHPERGFTGKTWIRLYNLASDPGEKTDLFQKEPARAKQLKQLWLRWNAEMIPPPRERADVKGVRR